MKHYGIPRPSWLYTHGIHPIEEFELSLQVHDQNVLFSLLAVFGQLSGFSFVREARHPAHE
jgi:hypothetical protein